jgi:hypothetical protein
MSLRAILDSMPYKDPADRREQLRRYRQRRRDFVSAINRAWRSSHAEELKEYTTRWRMAHAESMKRWGREYYQSHSEQIKERNREYRARLTDEQRQRARETRRKYKERRRGDIQYRLRNNLRARVREALKTGGRKCAGTMELLGCSIAVARVHIERQFARGMTWDNYGTLWQIDHIRPIVAFDLTQPEQQKIAFNYLNLRPLSTKHNLAKGGRHTHLL